MLPDLDPESFIELKNFSPFNAVPEMSSMDVPEDRGTLFRKLGGSAAEVGSGERIGRMEFVPAAPVDATILTIKWEEMKFEVPLGRSQG